MNEDDLRVQRTRKRLQEGLLELLSHTPYEDITVRDIAQQAQVGYRTFFRHYDSKEALLQAIIDTVIADFRHVRLAPEVPNAAEQNTLLMLQYVQKHAHELRLLLRTSAAEDLVAATLSFAEEEGKAFFSQTSLPDDLVAHHFAWSAVNLVRWWLEHDMPFPPEEMAVIINRLVIQPIKDLP